MPNRKDIYNFINNEGLTSKSYSDWSAMIDTPEGRRKAYDFYKENGAVTTDYETFSKTMTESGHNYLNINGKKTQVDYSTYNDFKTRHQNDTKKDSVPASVKSIVGSANDDTATDYGMTDVRHNYMTPEQRQEDERRKYADILMPEMAPEAKEGRRERMIEYAGKSATPVAGQKKEEYKPYLMFNEGENMASAQQRWKDEEIWKNERAYEVKENLMPDLMPVLEAEDKEAQKRANEAINERGNVMNDMMGTHPYMQGNIMDFVDMERETDPAKLMERVNKVIDSDEKFGEKVSELVMRRVLGDNSQGEPVNTEEGEVESKPLTPEEQAAINQMLSNEYAGVAQEIQNQIYNYYAQQGMPKGYLQYFLQGAMMDSLTGRIAKTVIDKLAHSSGMREQMRQQMSERYGEDVGMVGRAAKGAAAMLADSPAFGIAGMPAKIVGGWIGKTALGAALRVGMEQGGKMAMGTKLAVGALHSGTTFANYDLMNAAASQWQNNRWDAGELMESWAGGMKTGAALGVMGGMTGAIAERTASDIAKYAVKAGGYAGEVGLFSGMQVYEKAKMEGKDYWDIALSGDGAEILGEQAAMIGMLKMQHLPSEIANRNREISRRGMGMTGEWREMLKERGIDFSSFWSAAKSGYEMKKGADLSEVKDMAGAFGIKLKFDDKQQSALEMYEKIMKDDTLPQNLKGYFTYLVTGKYVMPSPVMGYDILNENGTARFTTKDAEGKVIDVYTLNAEDEAEERQKLQNEIRLNNTTMLEQTAASIVTEMPAAIMQMQKETDWSYNDITSAIDAVTGKNADENGIRLAPTEEQRYIYDSVIKIAKDRCAQNLKNLPQLREEVEDETGVDVSKALKKAQPKENERAAIDLYNQKLSDLLGRKTAENEARNIIGEGREKGMNAETPQEKKAIGDEVKAASPQIKPEMKAKINELWGNDDDLGVYIADIINEYGKESDEFKGVAAYVQAKEALQEVVNKANKEVQDAVSQYGEQMQEHVDRNGNVATATVNKNKVTLRDYDPDMEISYYVDPETGDIKHVKTSDLTEVQVQPYSALMDAFAQAKEKEVRDNLDGDLNHHEKTQRGMYQMRQIIDFTDADGNDKKMRIEGIDGNGNYRISYGEIGKDGMWKAERTDTMADADLKKLQDRYFEGKDKEKKVMMGDNSQGEPVNTKEPVNTEKPEEQVAETAPEEPAATEKKNNGTGVLTNEERKAKNAEIHASTLKDYNSVDDIDNAPAGIYVKKSTKDNGQTETTFVARLYGKDGKLKTVNGVQHEMDESVLSGEDFDDFKEQLAANGKTITNIKIVAIREKEGYLPTIDFTYSLVDSKTNQTLMSNAKMSVEVDRNPLNELSKADKPVAPAEEKKAVDMIPEVVDEKTGEKRKVYENASVEQTRQALIEQYGQDEDGKGIVAEIAEDMIKDAEKRREKATSPDEKAKAFRDMKYWERVRDFNRQEEEKAVAEEKIDEAKGRIDSAIQSVLNNYSREPMTFDEVDKMVKEDIAAIEDENVRKEMETYWSESMDAVYDQMGEMYWRKHLNDKYEELGSVKAALDSMSADDIEDMLLDVNADRIPWLKNNADPTSFKRTNIYRKMVERDSTDIKGIMNEVAEENHQKYLEWKAKQDAMKNGAEDGIRWRDGEEEEDTVYYTAGKNTAPNGEKYMEDNSGNTELCTIPTDVFEKMGVRPIPFRLTEGMAKHVMESRNLASLDEAVKYVLDIMNSYDHVREGRDKNTYVFSKEMGKTRAARRVIGLELQYKEGGYIGIKTAGHEAIRKIKESKILWEKGENQTSATGTVPANVTSDNPINDGKGNGFASNQSILLSEGKGSENAPYNQTNAEKIAADDEKYMNAVKNGDMETAQRMVLEKADREIDKDMQLASDDGVVGFQYHRGEAPKRTKVMFAVLNVTPEGFKAAYAGNKTGTPVGVWLDAVPLRSWESDRKKNDDGSYSRYVAGDTGASWTDMFTPERYEEMMKEDPTITKGTRWLYERGGKHGTDVPNFGQMNTRTNEAGEKVKSGKEGALPHNKLIFEIECGMDEDGDLTSYVAENGRFVKKKNQGMAWVGTNKFYFFKTNPNAVGNWGIAGTFRIKRLVPHDEIVRECEKAGVPVQKWVGGYHPEDSGLSVEMVDEMYKEGKKKKLMDAVTYDDEGNVIPLSQRFNMEKEDLRFRDDSQGEPVNTKPVKKESVDTSENGFYSPAEKAVIEVKQEKATGEQWLKMIEKAGGLKKEEDKWMGLSDWLKEQSHQQNPKPRAITKQEVLDFIRRNSVEVKEVTYADRNDGMTDEADVKEQVMNSSAWEGLMQDLTEYDENDYPYIDKEKFKQMAAEDENFRFGFSVDYWGEQIDIDDPIAAATYLGLNVDHPIHETRMAYTTDGLTDKREIALVVPSVEEYEGSLPEIHFTDKATGGKTVAWCRFGDYVDNDGKRVLVIDEIQSQRHQDGREKGYKEDYEFSAKYMYEQAKKEMNDYRRQMQEKYGQYFMEDDMTVEEQKRYTELLDRMNTASEYDSEKEKLYNVPDAPFQKNWHELAMKRMLRYAAENGYDKVAWTDGRTQAERYGIGNEVKSIYVYKADPVTGKEMDGKYYVRTYDYDDSEINSATGHMDRAKMIEIFGKDIATKLADDSDAHEKGWANIDLSSDDVKVGGEGMKGFYDQMLPRWMNKYGKKWGVKVSEEFMEGLSDGQSGYSVEPVEAKDNIDRLEAFRENMRKKYGELSNRTMTEEEQAEHRRLMIEANSHKKGLRMWSVPVTEEMKESVIWEGQPMWRFVGEKGMSRDAKANEYRLNNLEIAKQMYDQPDRDKRKIKMATGWEMGVDGKWRYEEPDIKLKKQDEVYNGEYGGAYTTIPLSNMLDEESIIALGKSGFDRYSLPGVEIVPWTKTTDASDTYEAAYERFKTQKKIKIWVGNDKLLSKQDRGRITDYSFKIDDEFRSVLAHELQHFIQEEEGFSTGSAARGREYIASSGEVEARNVQKRMKMTDEERRNSLASDTEDVERQDQIVRFTNGKSYYTKDTDKRHIEETVINTGNKLNVKVNVLRKGDEKQFSEMIQTKLRRGGKGWFNPKTGEIYIYLDNATDVGDAVKTMLHEIVGHKGMRDLLGAEQYDSIMIDMYGKLPDEMKDEVDALAQKKYKGNYAVAMDEYLAGKAEEGTTPSWWGKIVGAVRNALKQVFGMDLELTDGDIKYMLWKSYKGLANERDVFSVADDIAMRLRNGIGEFKRMKDNVASRIAEIRNAEMNVNVNPTDGQKKAGNYKMGHVKLEGYDITIENPKGSVRSGKDADGKSWSIEMNNTYGYIRGTEGVDGDHIDVFLSDDPESGYVFVVDQVNNDGSFDEHKVMYGFGSEDEAKKAYMANYSKGWTGLGNITAVSKEEFKKWINSSHKKTKPFAEYAKIKRLNSIIGRDGEVTKTKNFKNWFGDWEKEPEKASKVVDEDGKPLVVYHGTNRYGFTVFDTSIDRNGQNLGSHFGTKEAANTFTDNDKTYAVYLDIKNPYTPYYEDFFTNEDQLYADEAVHLAKKIDTPEAKKIADEIIEKYPMTASKEAMDKWWDDGKPDEDYTGDPFLVERFRKLLELGGYDGIIYNNWYEDAGHDSYVVLKPEQVKSASVGDEMENNGEFSRKNPDIRYAEDKEADKKYMQAVKEGNESKLRDMVKQAAKRFMPDTKVVDKNGMPLEVYHGTRNGGFTEFDLGYGYEGKGVFTSDDANAVRDYSKSDRRVKLPDFKDGDLDAATNWMNDLHKDLGVTWKVEKIKDEDGDDAWILVENDGDRIIRDKQSIQYSPEDMTDYIKDQYNNNIDSVYPVYLNIKNPYILDAKGASWKEVEFDGTKRTLDSILKQLKNEGKYDGLIVNNVYDSWTTDGTITEYIAFEPEQVKITDPVTYDDRGNVIPLSERFNSEEKDMRYAGEGDKSLVGVHNISEGQLIKALKLGGLANPSTAIIDVDKQNHERYGDISLVMPSSLVDSRTGNHGGTNAADIYSPDYPQVYKRFTDKNEMKMKDKIYELAGKYAGAMNIWGNFQSNLEHGRTGGLEYVFAKMKGADVDSFYHAGFNSYWEPYMKYRDGFELRQAMNEDPELAKEITKHFYDKEVSDQFRMMRSKLQKKEGENKIEFFNRCREWAKAAADMFIDKENGQWAWRLIDDEFNSQKKAYTSNGDFDHWETRNKVSNFISENNLWDEYAKWEEEFVNQYEPKEMLYDGQDREGQSKWVENTLKNASRMMKKQGKVNTDGFFNTSMGGVRAEFAPLMKTLDEIRENKWRLDKEKFEEQRNALEEQYTELAKFFDKEDSYDWNSKYYELVDAMKSGNAKKWADKNGFNITKEDGKMIDNFAIALKEMPTEYFELKFERPVKLDEFAGAVVPKSASEQVKKALRDAGLTLFEYDPEVEGDRKRAMQEASDLEDVRFRFVGEKGLQNDEEAMKNLGDAEMMEQMKNDPEADMSLEDRKALGILDERAFKEYLDKSKRRRIKMATGWERGADGKWRYETPDFEGKIDFSGNAQVRDEAGFKRYHQLIRKSNGFAFGFNEDLAEEEKKEYAELRKQYGTSKGWQVTDLLPKFVKDDKLFEMYPEMKNVQVSFVTMDGGKKAALVEPSLNDILDGKAVLPFRIELNSRMNEEEATSAMAHEIQHGVQMLEGFARGGSLESSVSKLQEIGKKMGIQKGQKMTINDMKRYLGYIKADIYNDLLDEAMKNGYRDIEDWIDDLNPFTYYHRLSGEVEARNVQTRMGMTDKQRRETLAEDTEDVKRNKQVVDWGYPTESNLIMGEKGAESLDEFEKDRKGMLKWIEGMEKAFGRNGKENMKEERARWEQRFVDDGTKRMKSLKVAVRMAKQKKSAKDIKIATGWEQGKDNKWRYEVGDAKIQNKVYDRLDKVNDAKFDVTAKLEQVIDAPELFEAYPRLKDMSVHFYRDEDSDYGGYARGYEIWVNTKDYKKTSDNMKLGGWTQEQVDMFMDLEKEGLNETINHEIQHVIQDIEGFAQGGNTEDVRRLLENVLKGNEYNNEESKEQLTRHGELVSTLYGIKYCQQLFRNPKRFLKWQEAYRYSGSKDDIIAAGQKWAVENYWKAMDDLEYDAIKWGVDLEKYGIDVDAIEKKISNMYADGKTPEQIAKQMPFAEQVTKAYEAIVKASSKSVEANESRETVKRYKDLENTLNTVYRDYELYRRLAGEVEARAVAERLNMTHEERRQSPVAESEDVSRKDQIAVSWSGKEMMGSRNSQGEPVNTKKEEEKVKDSLKSSPYDNSLKDPQDLTTMIAPKANDGAKIRVSGENDKIIVGNLEKVRKIYDGSSKKNVEEEGIRFRDGEEDEASRSTQMKMADRQKKSVKERGRLLMEDGALDWQDYVLISVGGGAKFKWNDTETSKGLGAHTTGRDSKEQKKAWRGIIDNKDGETPEEMAHRIWQGMPEAMKELCTDQDVMNEIIDDVRSYETHKDMLTASEKAHFDMEVESFKAEKEAALQAYAESLGYNNYEELQKAERDAYAKKQGYADYDEMMKVRMDMWAQNNGYNDYAQYMEQTNAQKDASAEIARRKAENERRYQQAAIQGKIEQAKEERFRREYIEKQAQNRWLRAKGYENMEDYYAAKRLMAEQSKKVAARQKARERRLQQLLAKSDEAESTLPEMPVREKDEKYSDWIVRFAEWKVKLDDAKKLYAKSHPVQAITRDEAMNSVSKRVDEQLKRNAVSSMDKSTLNSIMKTLKNTTPENVDEMLEEAERLVNHIQIKANEKELEKLLKLKTSDVNGKNMSIAKNVDEQTKRIMDSLEKRVLDTRTTAVDDRIHTLRSQNWHLREERRNTTDEARIREIEDAIDNNNEEIEDLTRKKRELLDEKRKQGDADVEQAISELEDKMNAAAEGSAQWTNDDTVAYTTLQLQKKIIENAKHEGERFEVENEMRNIRQQKAQLWEEYKDRLNAEKENADASGDDSSFKTLLDEYRNKRNALNNKLQGLRMIANESIKATIDGQEILLQDLKELVEGGKNGLMQKIENEQMRRISMITNALHDIRGGKKVDIYTVDKKHGKENMVKSAFTAALNSFDYLTRAIVENKSGEDGWMHQYFMYGKDGVNEAWNTYIAGKRSAEERLDAKVAEYFKDVKTGITRRKNIRTFADWQEAMDKKPKVGKWGEKNGIRMDDGEWATTGITVLDMQDVDENGQPTGKRIEWKDMTKGQATYAYMVWKMTDGRGKMLNMGFDDQSMEEVRKYIGDENAKMADWIQNELLTELREKYNERYREIYNTSMASIDNYVPLKILGAARRQEVDFSGDTGKGAGQLVAKTGSLINRTANSLPVDFSNSAAEVIWNHINEMEEFNAYARVRKDLSCIFSSNAFKNQLNTNSSGMFTRLRKAAEIATMTEQDQKVGALDNLAGKLQKPLAGSAIAFRYSTALKQILSAPAFYGYTDDPVFATMLTYNIMKDYGRNAPAIAANMLSAGIFGKKMFKQAEEATKSYKAALGADVQWCIKNLPDFWQRVSLGAAGDNRLAETFLEKGGWYSKKYMEIGMSPNKMVDAVTVAIGAKTIYDYEMMKEKGYNIGKKHVKGRMEKLEERIFDGVDATEERKEQWRKEYLKEADRMAKAKAVGCYNQSQQSNNPAYLSAQQTGKTLVDRAMSLFKNSPISYARKMYTSIQDLNKLVTRRKKMESSYMHQYLREMGVTEQTATYAQIAEAKIQSHTKMWQILRKSALNAIMFGWFTNWIWNKGGQGILGFMAEDDDDDDKDKNGLEKAADNMLEFLKYPAQGTFGMDFISNAANGAKTGLTFMSTNEYDKFMQNYNKAKEDYGHFSPEIFNLILNVPTKFSIGLDLDTWQNMYMGAERMAKSEGKIDEMVIAYMYFMNSPKSQRAAVAKNIFKEKYGENYMDHIDEYVRDVERAIGYTVDEDIFESWMPAPKALKAATESRLKREFIEKNLTAEEKKAYEEKKKFDEDLKKADLMRLSEMFKKETNETRKEAIMSRYFSLDKKEHESGDDKNMEMYNEMMGIKESSKNEVEQAWIQRMTVGEMEQESTIRRTMSEIKKEYDDYKKFCESTHDVSAIKAYKEEHPDAVRYEEMRKLKNEISKLRKEWYEHKEAGHEKIAQKKKSEAVNLQKKLMAM